jgi:hypothetical protein
MPSWRGSKLPMASVQSAAKNAAPTLPKLALWRYLCSSSLSSRASRGLGRALLVSIATAALACSQTTKRPRVNELTLARLRPGRDSLAKAIHIYGVPNGSKQGPDEKTWEDFCRSHALTIENDKSGRIQTVRVTRHDEWPIPACELAPRNPWQTGHGLAMNDSTLKIVHLYGPPDSKSPSTRDGQPLELWYYAFDWAGPDVPQVMEVLCTTEKDGQPGRVIEITLAAPSL